MNLQFHSLAAGGNHSVTGGWSGEQITREEGKGEEEEKEQE